MAYEDIFKLSHEDGKITITADQEIIKDLIFALNTLLDLSHAVRAKINFARAIEAANNKEDIERRQNEFKRISEEVFIQFQKHLNNGCNGDKAKAIQCIKKDFGMGYTEAQIYISNGRKFLKAKKGRPSRKLNPDAEAQKPCQ